jgi:uncharacterized cupin superfamily protein
MGVQSRDRDVAIVKALRARSIVGGDPMTKLQVPAIDPSTVEAHVSADKFYPRPFNEPCRGREWRQLGDAAGLTQFGVNLVRLQPGSWSSQRHWHQHEDEFVYILEGEVTLVTDAGRQLLRAGMAAGFPAATRDGHHLINHTDHPATLIEVGTRARSDEGEYPDIDMKFVVRDGVESYLHKSGDPY